MDVLRVPDGGLTNHPQTVYYTVFSTTTILYNYVGYSSDGTVSAASK